MLACLFTNELPKGEVCTRHVLGPGLEEAMASE